MCMCVVSNVQCQSLTNGLHGSVDCDKLTNEERQLGKQNGYKKECISIRITCPQTPKISADNDRLNVVC